jgi:hypothetical protein
MTEHLEVGATRIRAQAGQLEESGSKRVRATTGNVPRLARTGSGAHRYGRRYSVEKPLTQTAETRTRPTDFSAAGSSRRNRVRGRGRLSPRRHCFPVRQDQLAHRIVLSPGLMVCLLPRLLEQGRKCGRDMGGRWVPDQP